MTMERDFPIGHPAASDYNGEPYSPPRAPYGEDFPEGHPARDGKNVSTLDMPDGFRAAHLAQEQSLIELASVGALPPLLDSKNNEPIDLTPEQLAAVYAMAHGLLAEAEHTELYVQLCEYLEQHGYTEDQAKAIVKSYCTPILQR